LKDSLNFVLLVIDAMLGKVGGLQLKNIRTSTIEIAANR
jgi:hypothetical protein